MNGTLTIGLVPHREKLRAHELTHQICDWFAARNIDVLLPEEEAQIVGLPDRGVSFDDLIYKATFIISIGGDGTMLRAMELAYQADALVVGVNAGALAYLSEIEPDELDTCLKRIVAGNFEIQKRMVAEATLEIAGKPTMTKPIINEIVLERENSGRLAWLSVVINGAFFTTYAADGLIVATPTGSTAYALSARGPIVSPRQECLLLTPVSPHTLFDRSLVLGAQETVELEVLGPNEVVANIDGRRVTVVPVGGKATVRASKRSVKIAMFHERDFHQILKSKFKLADR